MNLLSTKERILLEAEALIQTKGYNAFSFKDIATTIQIKTASIHYYFPSKEDLGIAVIQWYGDKVSTVYEAIYNNDQWSKKEKLHQFFEAILKITYYSDNKMCLGGMFASDMQSLPLVIQNKIKDFFKRLLHRLEAFFIISEPQDQALSTAKHLMALIEGSLLLARLYNDTSYLEEVRYFINHSIR